MDEDLLTVLRLQAWERAKGELRSVGQASGGYSDELMGDETRRLGRFFVLLEVFIEQVEEHNLLE